MSNRTPIALMLSGGGARAAYQVGVLKAITTFLPRNHSIPFPILCGTSAGAINATALACYASCYHLGIRKLEWVWKNFKTHQVYSSSMRDTFSYLAHNYFSGFQSEDVPQDATSLLNNTPLRHLIRSVLDFKRIDRNLITEHLHAVSVTASSYSHHEAVSYFQSKQEIANWSREKRRGVKCTLEVDHLLASSAIPLVFPTVNIDGDFFGDGAVHQLSPLSTPIHLGAEKIFVVGVEQPEKSSGIDANRGYPTTATITGHLLDTLFADSLDADLERLQRVNQTLSLLNKKQLAATELKSIDCLVLNPSENIQAMASSHYGALPSGIKTLLKLIGINANADSSILSYLLFEGVYCQELINLGYKDGLTHQDKIRDFLEI